jgi:hypothetical protein
MKPQVFRLLYRTEGNQANLIRLADFFERPANARVPRQAFATIG